MGRPRLDLQTLLENFADHVYFQPPANVKMEYPAIRYMRDASSTQFAENAPYRRHKRYQVTVIDRDPDSAIPDRVEALPLCKFDRVFVADNLYHFVFSLYF